MADIKRKLISEEPDASTALLPQSSDRKLSRRKKTILASLFVFFCVAGIVAFFFFSGDSQTDKDNKKASTLFDELSDEVSSGSVTVDSGKIGSGVLETMGIDQVVLESPSVRKQAGSVSSNGRQVVILSGQTTVGSAQFAMQAEMHFYNDELRSVVHLITVDQSSVPLSSVLPNGQVDPSFSNIFVVGPVLTFSSFDGSDPVNGASVSQGVGISAQWDATQTSEPCLDVMKGLVGSERSMNLTGSLKPAVKLDAKSSPGKVIHLGKYIVLENVTQNVNKSAKTAAVAALMVVSLPKMSNLTLNIAGTASYGAKKMLHIEGNQVGNWDIHPNLPKDLVMSNADVSMDVLVSGKDVSFSGSIGAALTYGELTGGLELDLPPNENVVSPGGDKGVALEILFDDSHIFNHFPICKNKAVPELMVTKSALVLTPVTGTYTLKFPGVAPAATEPVVAGLNMFASIDLSASSSLAPLKSLGNGDIDVFLSGYFAKNGNFLLKGELVDYVGKDDKYTVKDASLTISSTTGSKQNLIGLILDAHVIIPASVLNTATDLDIVVTGDVNSEKLDLNGVLTAEVDVKIGDHTFDMDKLTIQFSHAPQGKPTKTHVRVELFLEGQEISAVMEYPGANQGSHECTALTITDRHVFSFGHVFDKYLPSQDRGFGGNVDASVLDHLLQGNLTDIVFFASPQCSNFSISAKLEMDCFGSSQVGMVYDQSCDSYPCSSPHKFHIYIIPGKDWHIDSADFIPKDLPIALCLPVFVLSSAEDKITIPVSIGPNSPCIAIPGSRISINTTIVVDTTADGITVKATMLISDEKNAKVVKGFVPPHVTELDVTGVIAKNTWSLDIELGKQGTSLGHGIVLTTAHLKLSKEGGLDFGGELQVPAPVFTHSPSNDTILFDADVKYDNDQMTVTGSVKDGTAPTIGIPIGHSGLTLEDLEVELVVSGASANGSRVAITGYLKGKINVGLAHIDVEIDLLTNYVFKFIGHVSENPPLTFGGLVSLIAGSDVLDKLPLPETMRHDIENDWAFNSLDITFVTNPPSFSAVGVMTLFGKDGLDVVVDVGMDSASTWQFLIGVHLGLGSSDVKFSSVVKGVSCLDNMGFGSIAVIVSSHSASVQFPGVPTAYNALHGFNFYATLNMMNNSAIPGLESIAKWTGMDELEVTAQIESAKEFSIHADVKGDMHIMKRVDMTAGGFFVNVKTTDVQIGVEADAVIAVSSRPNDQLHFHGDVFVGVQGLGFDVAMTNDWVDPLGAKGITILRSDLSLELSWALVPVEVGLAGGLLIGDVGGQAAIWLAEDAQMVYAELDNINLQQIVDSLFKQGHSPPHLVQVMTDISFKTLKLYVNTDPQPLVFFNKTYYPGFLFTVEDLDMWEIIRGSATVSITKTTGLKVDAVLQPISLLDGELVISGARSEKDPAYLHLAIGDSNVVQNGVNISGGVTLFTEHLATEVVIEDNIFELYIDMRLVDNLFKFTLDCSLVGTIKKPTDFSFYARVNNEVQDWLEEHIPAMVNKTKDEVDAKLDHAKVELEQKKADLQSIDAKIKKYQQEDAETRTKDEQKLVDAQLDVMKCKQHVDELENKIHQLEDEIKHLKWYEKWKAVPLGVEIAGLWVAKNAADVALDAANEVLKLAEKVINKLPAIDPRIIALKVEEGVARSALDLAESLVGSLEDVFDGLVEMTEKIAIWQGKQLNLELLEVSGSLKAIKHGDLCHLRAKGSFLDHSFDDTIDIDLGSIESWLHSLWEHIVDLFKHKHASFELLGAEAFNWDRILQLN